MVEALQALVVFAANVIVNGIIKAPGQRVSSCEPMMASLMQGRHAAQ